LDGLNGTAAGFSSSTCFPKPVIFPVTFRTYLSFGTCTLDPAVTRNSYNQRNSSNLPGCW